MGKLWHGIYLQFRKGIESFEELNREKVIERYLSYRGLPDYLINEKLEQIKSHAVVIKYLSTVKDFIDIEKIGRETNASPDLVSIIIQYLEIYDLKLPSSTINTPARIFPVIGDGEQFRIKASQGPPYELFKRPKIPYIDLIRHIIKSNSPFLYYFCWLGAITRGDLHRIDDLLQIGELLRPGPLGKAAKYLSSLKVDNTQYNLIKVDTFTRPGHNEPEARNRPWYYPITKQGLEIYDRLKDYGFIEILFNKFTIENPNCFINEEQFRNCFRKYFLLEGTPKFFYRGEAIKNLENRIEFNLIEDNAIKWDNFHKYFFKVSYNFADVGEDTILKGLDLSFSCTDCQKPTVFEIKVLDIIDHFQTEQDYEISCRHCRFYDEKVFVVSYNFNKFKVKLLSRGIPRAPIITKKDLLTCFLKPVESGQDIIYNNEIYRRYQSEIEDIGNQEVRERGIVFLKRFRIELNELFSILYAEGKIYKNDDSVFMLTEEGKSYLENLQ